MSNRAGGRNVVLSAVTITWISFSVVVVGFLATTQISYTVHREVAADDFLATIWVPGQQVLDGITAYPDPSLAGFTAESVYPPLIILSALSLAPLGFDLAVAVWTAVLALCAVGTLWVLGVRDWRLYLLYLASAPVVFGLLWGNVTILVAFLVALVWTYRDRELWAGALVALAVAIKLLVAPLCLWFLFRRRYRAALVSAVATPLLIVAPWALLGFDGLTWYPRTLRSLTETHGAVGAGVQPLVRQLGFERGVALTVGVVVGLVCLTVAWRSRNELLSYAWTLGSALAFAPVIWMHYYALLAVPLAVARPRAGGAWWLFLALWVSWALSPLEWASAQLSIAVVSLVTLLLATLHLPRLGSRSGIAGRPVTAAPTHHARTEVT